VCSGASQDEPKSGTDLDHYNHLKRMYTNCTYVLGNVIVHSMKSLNNVSLDFFSSIVEVSGYVRVMGDMPLGVTNLPFSRLKIIRGESLTKYSDTHENEFSLFIYNVNQITSLGLTELRGEHIYFLLFETNNSVCFSRFDFESITQIRIIISVIYQLSTVTSFFVPTLLEITYFPV